MIYLIGGAPKCGKTTLAKELSRSKGIPWVSTDTLQCVVRPYMKEEELKDAFPVNQMRGANNDEKYALYSKDEIIEAYRNQAKTTYQAVDMFCICEITDGNDFIIEGYHIEPELVSELSQKYPGKIQGIFLGKTDVDMFVRDIKKSSTPNDWIIAKTHDEATYIKIADMICEYSRVFESEAKKYDLKFINMDKRFEEKIEDLVKRF